ncbi:MAG TPA: type II toxin-antitoxin system RelE/ParE family toxin [Beijerinckiaceae bacterium]|jgi:plasmid stabilization system protein ParE|nr:type II toxin-antitoxin system RelE/ParE family toxin [Beijerinckiaceae bacterium]
MKLRFTPRALENIAAIADYLREHNPKGSARVRSAIYDGLRNLILFPHVGRLQKTEGVRKFVTRRYAYLIYYAVDEHEEEIIILSVKHASQEREHKDA